MEKHSYESLHRDITELAVAQARTEQTLADMRDMLIALCAKEGIVASRPGTAAAATAVTAPPPARPAAPPALSDGPATLGPHHQAEPFGFVAADMPPSPRPVVAASGRAKGMKRRQAAAATAAPPAILSDDETTDPAEPSVVLAALEAGTRLPPAASSRPAEVSALLRIYLHSDESAPTPSELDAGGSTGAVCAHAAALMDAGEVLVKTVGNRDWRALLAKLSNSSPAAAFKTSTTLLPPRGLGLKLFGAAPEHCVGLIWDIAALGVTDENAFAWPSGYYAKVEFNLNKNGELLNGRKEALTTLAKLRAFNRQISDDAAAAASSGAAAHHAVPYNEVYAPVHAGAIVGVFARVPSAECVLFALGVAQQIALLPAFAAARQAATGRGTDALDAAPPIFLMPNDYPARPLSAPALARVARDYLFTGDSPNSDNTRAERYPMQLPRAVAKLLSPAECASFYGMYGASPAALDALVGLAADVGSQVAEGGGGRGVG
eukprot:CAMPEP_0206062080 /NCGR_PEP_ID=MMETSP1466-20131121/55957_1 /ASSEMBLY_ACC=CAM_ASM_001126 /TAXON_ID=44452 /ORGANISM="Pavlova gyrans, Strain CCMP608" /LENGTH=491 /DNA_ID=CAMNT_0053437439 /DNA_START=1 /DNA_END=1473 /DNA_ORIENTATION=+